MAAELTTAANVTGRKSALTDTRCPHLVFRNVLGAATVAGLLDLVAAREQDFRPGVIRNRESGQQRVDYRLQDNLHFTDLGAFETPIDIFVREIAPLALAQLHLNEPNVEPREFEIISYRDGSHFGAHIDTDERLGRVRILSCVYYFAATPRRFSGGELRIYGFPTLTARKAGGPLPFVDVVPETDSLVVFPSWLRHEVLPVRVPSGAWLDGRFTINCWVHRTNPSGATTSAAP